MTEQDNQRFYITNGERESVGILSPVIKDKTTDEVVCEDIYETLQLLNELTGETETEDKCSFDSEALIHMKEMRLTEIESMYFKLLTAELDLKNAENTLWLNTDFKAQGLTNDKMRSAFVSDAVSSLRFERDMAKYKLKQQEDALIIIDDLLKQRMQEVK